MRMVVIATRASALATVVCFRSSNQTRHAAFDVFV
jgi:hypothetical protein